MTLAQAIASERTNIRREAVAFPSAWKAADLGGKANVSLTLTPRLVEIVEELLEGTRDLLPQDITRDRFSHPELDAFLRGAFEEIMHGRGFVVITGLPADKYAQADLERIFMGVGTHWGRAVVQSPRGDRIGHVRYVPPSPEHANRAYTSKGELVPHCDAHEIVGLMCVQRARTGGESGLMSSLAAHNELLAERPDLLEALYEGHQFATREALHRGQELTPYKVPVFSEVDGKLSCFYNRAYIYKAEQFTGKLPDDLVEGMSFLNAFFEREDVKIEFMLEPGEMVVWHNFTVVHSRTHFDDDDDPRFKRHLLRLWLDVPDGRPMLDVYHRDLVAGL